MQLLLLKDILVAADPDDLAFSAVMTAARLASAAGAALHVVSVVTGASRDHVGDAIRSGLANALERAGTPVDADSIHVVEDDPARAIDSCADRIGADVIVLGRHRAQGSSTHSIGGTAIAVVTTASIPCLVASAPLRLPLRRVLVPLDVSDAARGALLVGLSWASALRNPADGDTERQDAVLTALHVLPSAEPGTRPSMPAAIQRGLDTARAVGGKWAGVSIQGETVINPDVTQGIATYVSEQSPDLLVIGTSGLGFEAIGRLGSVAASVVTAVDVPTLLVPPAVWLAHAGR